MGNRVSTHYLRDTGNKPVTLPLETEMTGYRKPGGRGDIRNSVVTLNEGHR